MHFVKIPLLDGIMIINLEHVANIVQHGNEVKINYSCESTTTLIEGVNIESIDNTMQILKWHT